MKGAAWWKRVRPKPSYLFVRTGSDRDQMAKSINDCGAIALTLADSTMKELADFWSRDTIRFVISKPGPRSVNPDHVKEIVFRSIQRYLERPGHVNLDNGTLGPDDIQCGVGDGLLRANLLLRYWTGSRNLPRPRYFTVSGVLPDFFAATASYH